MQIPKEAISSFQKIWKEEFQEDLSEQQANEEASRLIRLFQILLKKD